MTKPTTAALIDGGEDISSDPALRSFYADRKLMWRNVFFIQLGWAGHNICFTVLGLLWIWRAKDLGFTEATIGLLGAINSWAVSFLVMYFSWKSDHFVSRLGRRVPFLLISMPFIVAANVLFPFVTSHAAIIGLYLVGAFFMDMKMSTYPLLNIDCVARDMLGRVGAIGAVISGITGFLSMRYGLGLAKDHFALTYVVCATVLAVFTLIAAFGIREPPIRNPATECFKPWSTFKVGWKDKRIIWLMVGTATIMGFSQTMSWLILFAKKDLALDLAGVGQTFAWPALIAVIIALPVGWLIDHVSGFKLITLVWFGQLAAFVMLMQLQNMAAALGLSAISLLVMIPIMQSLYGAFYPAADFMIYRSTHPKDIGSMTSTLSCLRNMCAGLIAFSSGWLITATGTNYRSAFIMGIILSTLSLPTFFVFRYLKQRKPGAAVPVIEAEEELGTLKMDFAEESPGS